jgi:hypothetical protein
MNSIPNTPGCSGKSAGWLHISGVEKIQRCFPRIPGKFSMLINNHERFHQSLDYRTPAQIYLGGQQASAAEEDFYQPASILIR